MTKDPLEYLTDYGGHIYEEAYQVSIDTDDARKAMLEYGEWRAIGFIEWVSLSSWCLNAVQPNIWQRTMESGQIEYKSTLELYQLYNNPLNPVPPLPVK